MKVQSLWVRVRLDNANIYFCRLLKPPDGVLHYPEAPASRARRSKLCWPDNIFPIWGRSLRWSDELRNEPRTLQIHFIIQPYHFIWQIGSENVLQKRHRSSKKKKSFLYKQLTIDCSSYVSLIHKLSRRPDAIAIQKKMLFKSKHINTGSQISF